MKASPMIRAGAGLILCLASLLACGAPAPRTSGPPRRIVSLAPSITEILFALDAGERVVGVCAQCNYPGAVARLPRVGGYLVPSVEAVLATRPELVVAVPSPGNHEAVRAVERAGVRVLVVQDRTLDDLWATVRALAEVLERREAGERLVAHVQAGLDGVRARVAGLPARRALMVVSHYPLVAVGSGTLQHELLGMAGGINVAADAGARWPTMTLELVVERAPDVILDAAMGPEGGPGLFSGLDAVPAVHRGRVVSVSADTLFRAGPRVPEAAEALARALHPEAFVPAAAPG